jgi:hypothetical protein
MLISGVVPLGFSGLTEDWATLSWSAIEPAAWVSWGFLVICGGGLVAGGGLPYFYPASHHPFVKEMAVTR